jgi:3-oxoadipate enol-lactonase
MRAEIDGIELEFFLDGPATAPVVTFNHSLASDHSIWRRQVEALTDRYRVLTYDLRGHGRSSAPPGPYTIDQLGGDVVALLDHLGIRRTHLVGLSLGGMVAQWVGIYHSELLHSLVLTSTTSHTSEEGRLMWQERARAVLRDGTAPQIEPTLARWFTPPFRESHPDVVAEIAQLIRTTPPQGYAGCCNVVGELNLAPKLPHIQAPALVVAGSNDPGVPLVAAQLTAGSIPGARLEVIPNAAHLLTIEQADAYNALLRQFLDSQDTR